MPQIQGGKGEAVVRYREPRASDLDYTLRRQPDIMKIRTKTFLTLLGIVPLGFIFKFYSGPHRGWFNNYGAGVLYEIFWIMVVFFAYPSRRAANRIPFYVFAVTGALEILQLWHPPFLEPFRSSFVGRALIGTTFAWGDFPHYAIGCLLGWVWLRYLLKGKK
jgi:hypothetical protein